LQPARKVLYGAETELTCKQKFIGPTLRGRQAEDGMSLKVIFAMNLTKKVSTFVSSLVCLFAFSEASAQTLPNGTFDKTSFGPIEISCVSSSLCFASYEDGKSFMYLTSPDDNNQFFGFWAEPDASQTCSAVHQFPNISTNA
jgi:hypothetical protein